MKTKFIVKRVNNKIDEETKKRIIYFLKEMNY